MSLDDIYSHDMKCIDCKHEWGTTVHYGQEQVVCPECDLKQKLVEALVNVKIASWLK